MEKNEKKTKNSHRSLFLIISAVLCFVCLALLILSDIFGWIVFHDVMAYIMPVSTALVPIALNNEKSEFIQMIADRIRIPLTNKWDEFFKESFENDSVTPHLKELGNCIKETLQKSFYNRAYATRQEMFEDRLKEESLLKKSGKTITFLSLAGKFPSALDHIRDIMDELENKNITIYVLDPSSPCAIQREREFANYGKKTNFIQDIVDNVDYLNKELQKRVKQAKENNVDLKDFKLFRYEYFLSMTGVIFDIDDKQSEYYITPYLLIESANDCPSFFFDKSNMIAHKKYSTILKTFYENSNTKLTLDNEHYADKWVISENTKLKKDKGKKDERK
jgi:hypothetical protein